MNLASYGQSDDLRARKSQAHAETGAVVAQKVAFASDIALFLDVDGTLLDIADHPSAVATPDGLVTALSRARTKLGGAVALVSGRPIDELDRLFSPLRLAASGVHGAEMRLDPAEESRPVPQALQIPEALVAAVVGAARAIPGVFVEQKIYSLAVHYRAAPNAGRELRELLDRLIESEGDRRVEILEAHFAYELKMSGLDKGRAIAMFLESAPFRGRAPVFIGDDTTDEAGFAAVAAHGGSA